MNSPSQTTEFSAHLSWAGMRRYLQEMISPEKSQRVERHLRHCPRCSSAILDYIQAEEPEHQKQYTKRLKGILKTGQSGKKDVLSSFQMKAIRTSTAVIALLIFSFFALKTVINKQTDYALPSESLAVVEKSNKAAPVRLRPLKKVIEAPAATKEDPKKATAVVDKTSRAPQEAASPTKAPTVVTKARTAPVVKPSDPAVAAPVRQAQPSSKPQSEVVDIANESSTPSTNPEELSIDTEETTEAPANETIGRKSLPPLQKIDATQDSDVVAPLDENHPAEMPVPSNQIFEQ